MRAACFPILGLAWLAAMGALAALGPLGRSAPASMALYGCAFALLAAMLRACPERLDGRRAFLLFFSLGLAARLAFLPFPTGTDLQRYIWEGAVQNLGFNPYSLAPDHRLLAPLAQGELNAVWRGVNHKWFSAIYPPLPMLLFRLMAAVSPTPLFFKSVFLAADLALMVVLWRLIRLRGLPASRLLLYAANPLAIVFVAGEGHLDVLQALFLSLACLQRERAKGCSAALCLGLAVMTKYLALAALPFLLRRDDGARNLAVLIPLALFLPYLDAGPALFGTLAAFGATMHYNDSLAALLRWALGPVAPAVAAACLAASLVWVWLTEDDPLRGAFLALGCLLVFLPTVHPWYLLLVAPLLCVFPSPAWLYLQAAMLFTFPVMAGELAHGVFQEIHWLKLPAYLPFFGLLAWGLRGGRGPGREARDTAPGQVSVVIPALDEAETLPRCLDALAGAAEVGEVIVVDGGSRDDTRRLAAAGGAKVIRSARGRGRQIRAGCEAAQGEVILVVHADGVLERNAPRRVLAALAARPEALGGCFGMAFDGGGWRRALIARLNNLRAAVTGIAFGDQAQFVRAGALARLGGFPPLMLMEDVELSLRMRRGGGRTLYLGRGLTVSGRRWRQGGLLGKLWTVLALFFRFLVDRRLGRSHEFDAAYYRRYYGGAEGR